MKSHVVLTAVPAARASERMPFHARYLNRAPASPGVYLLYRGHRLIYIGLAAAGATIRERLRDHLRGGGGTCTRSATGFNCETAADAPALYQHYIAVYLDATGGRLPDCNEAPEQ